MQTTTPESSFATTTKSGPRAGRRSSLRGEPISGSSGGGKIVEKWGLLDRDPLAGWENVDTQNVDTSGLEGRAKERDDLERLSEPWTDGAESSDQEQPADRRVIPGQEERPENEPGDSRMDGDPEPLQGDPRTALDDRKPRSRRRTPDGGEDDGLVQAAPKRAGQGKTEKNQRMRTGPFPRP